MKAVKGEWVNIHKIILTADERAMNIPEDTKKVPLEMWVKGFLVENSASIGDKVSVRTITGREETGNLVDINPTYRHSFGEFIPELLQVGIKIKEILFGGEHDEK